MKNARYYKLLADAFVNDPMCEFLFQDEAKRYDTVKEMFSFMFDLGVGYGKLITHEDVGLVVYADSYLTYKSAIHQIKKGALRIPFTIGWRNFLNVLTYERFAQMLRNKYAKKDDVYLFIIAVDPAQHGKGIGSSLISELKTLTPGRRIYLETSNPRNIPFYEKNGFRQEKGCRLPGSDVYIWPMIYEDRSVEQDLPCSTEV